MVSEKNLLKKQAYFHKLISLVQSWPRILIVGADHVGSKQMSDIRVCLRGKAVVLMGKNTMIRTALRLHMDEVPTAENLIPLVKYNVGFVFCINDPSEVRRLIMEKKVPAPARQGIIAPNDVWVPAGPTGMDPSQTSFFQALGIATKIVKGQIEIQSDVHLIKKDAKVSASESVLLQKLNVKPFTYGLKVLKIFDDGSVYAADALDITDDEVLEKFKVGIQNIAAMSRQIGIPTEASISHSMVEGFKNCAALVLETDFTFREMEGLKKFIQNPEAFASVAPTAAPAASVGGGGGKAAVVEEKEEEEEEDDDMGFSLFD